MPERIITFNYAKNNFDAYKKQTIPDTLKCMTKTEVIDYINVDTNLLTSYVTNQLIPRSKVLGLMSDYSNYCFHFNGTVYDIKIQTDGKLIVVGSFTKYKGLTANGIARLNTDGTLDTSFNTGTGLQTSYPENYGNASGLVCQIQTDGKILIGGNFDKFNTVTRYSLIRLNTDGTLDTSFDAGLLITSNNSVTYNTICYDILLFSSSIYVCGYSFKNLGNTQYQTDVSTTYPTGYYTPTNLNVSIAKLNSVGTYDSSFATNMSNNRFLMGDCNSMTTDGTYIYLSGEKWPFVTNSIYKLRPCIIKILSSGVKDSAFPETLTNPVRTVYKLLYHSATNKIIYGGSIQLDTNQNNGGSILARCNTNGTSDASDAQFFTNTATNTTFNNYDQVSELLNMSIDSDNNLLISGAVQPW